MTVVTTFVVTTASAQSTLGELLDKGGKKLAKDDATGMMPIVVKYQWPQGGGEGDLVFRADGTLAGTEFHYPSRSESPATGTWSVDDAGKWCVKKTMTAWNTKTDLCWFYFRSGDDFFQSLSDTDRQARVYKVKSVTKP